MNLLIIGKNSILCKLFLENTKIKKIQVHSRHDLNKINFKNFTHVLNFSYNSKLQNNSYDKKYDFDLKLSKLVSKYKMTYIFLSSRFVYSGITSKFKEELNSHELDLLFIDGDHTLDGVKNDYVRYSKYVKKGGYIIFDDYHHPIIKEYCDKLLKENSSIKLITKFKSFKTDAIDLLVQKV